MIVLNRCIALKTDEVRKHFPPSQSQQNARLNVGRAEKLPEREILHKRFFGIVHALQNILFSFICANSFIEFDGNVRGRDEPASCPLVQYGKGHNQCPPKEPLPPLKARLVAAV